MASQTTSSSKLKACANSAAVRLESFCSRCDERYLLLAVLAVAVILRASRAYFTPILNVDTSLYLFQAKALYYGEWQAVNSCILKSVSIHPICSSLLFALTHDWVISLVATSIIFGTLTIIPIYYASRLFFPINTSLIVALSYSVMYVFVSAGVDIGRDAPFWFFSACGIYFFSAGLKKDKAWLFPLSTVFFMLAAWNRMEAIMFLALSPLYLLFKTTNRKYLKIAGFIAPILFGIGIICLMQDLNIQLVHRRNELIYLMTDAVKSYQNLRVNLSGLINSGGAGFDIEFLKHVRTLLWMLGINIVINSTAQAFFYPFFLIFLFGLLDLKKWRENSESFYYAFLISGALLILYVFVMRFWFLENRYVTLLILPAFIFIGFGIERLLLFMSCFLKLRQSTATILIVCLVLACSLPAQIGVDSKDKEVFKKIGAQIYKLENGSKEIPIMVAGAYFRALHLYSNMETSGLSCPDEVECNSNFGSNYHEFVNSIDRCKARYVVWEEKYWPAKFDLLKEYDHNDFLIIGEWHHNETGRIVLLKRLRSV